MKGSPIGWIILFITIIMVLVGCNSSTVTYYSLESECLVVDSTYCFETPEEYSIVMGRDAEYSRAIFKKYHAIALKVDKASTTSKTARERYTSLNRPDTTHQIAGRLHNE